MSYIKCYICCVLFVLIVTCSKNGNLKFIRNIYNKKGYDFLNNSTFQLKHFFKDQQATTAIKIL